jgi:hypothetical protein
MRKDFRISAISDSILQRMNNCRRELKTAHRTSAPTKTKVCDNLTKGEFPGGVIRMSVLVMMMMM